MPHHSGAVYLGVSVLACVGLFPLMPFWISLTSLSTSLSIPGIDLFSVSLTLGAFADTPPLFHFGKFGSTPCPQ